ncbi:hypothetical protein AAFF_G00087710 [Aldrovandia affinis]|uniref:Cell cycle progression protein 1 n=1 Tax=Aldrovandia affinis TaxID=143900 RepID=A0AAD7RWP5_9TELE|nr:hypothetical protein AAFF_G00087710 [Aldrovandia affinis]
MWKIGLVRLAVATASSYKGKSAERVSPARLATRSSSHFARDKKKIQAGGNMSESSSDTESSCGWTLISNEGSDIETLGSENGADGGADLPQGPPGLEEEQEGEEEEGEEEEVMQNKPMAPCAGCNEEKAESSLDATLKEETVEESLAVSEAGEAAGVEEHVTLGSSSDHSDIVTLEPSRGPELEPWGGQPAPEDEESLGSEELYLGTSSSSQYTFSTPEKTLFPVEPPAGDSSSTSSSEDEAGEQPSQTLKRRRVRRITVTTPTPAPAPEIEEVQWAGRSEREPEPQDACGAPPQGHINGTLNKCILLALVVAISMGFGHFYGTVQVKGRQKLEDRICVSELSDLRDDLHHCQREQDLVAESKEVVQHLRQDLEDERRTVLSLVAITDKITKENEHLRLKQAELQVQKDDLTLRLTESREQTSAVESRQGRLATENEQLRGSLEREEESLSTLQDELLSLRGQIRSLEERRGERGETAGDDHGHSGHGGGSGPDSILSENRRLKDHLEEEKQRVRSFLRQKETLMAEAQTLRRELDRERRVTDGLKEELGRLSRGGGAAGEAYEADPETEELQARLAELEKKLNFEQQRSDLWERLYDGGGGGGGGSVIGKVAETFDAVKNSTKEFVHHHKEQIKKAKEAVKENLRKFSDSVKSTLRHFKDSARRPREPTAQEGKEAEERKEAKAAEAERHQHPKEQEQEQEQRDVDSDGQAWQHKAQKPLHHSPRKSTAESFQADRNARKPGATVHEEPEQGKHRGAPKGCSSVFDCAYQESMSLFNKALDPIRVEEFNQLIHRYLQQEVHHFHHWRELESFINSFFHNGVFIHDQMLFTDFVSGVEDYLEDMDEYQQHDDDVFEDLDEYVYRHFFGDTYAKRYGPRSESQ